LCPFFCVFPFLLLCLPGWRGERRNSYCVSLVRVRHFFDGQISANHILYF
jgi:hypothetical protein